MTAGVNPPQTIIIPVDWQTLQVPHRTMEQFGKLVDEYFVIGKEWAHVHLEEASEYVEIGKEWLLFQYVRYMASSWEEKAFSLAIALLFVGFLRLLSSCCSRSNARMRKLEARVAVLEGMLGVSASSPETAVKSGGPPAPPPPTSSAPAPPPPSSAPPPPPPPPSAPAPPPPPATAESASSGALDLSSAPKLKKVDKKPEEKDAKTETEKGAAAVSNADLMDEMKTFKLKKVDKAQ